MVNKDVTILERTIGYEGFFLLERYRLQYRLFSCDWSRPVIRELFERGNTAAVIPYDPVRDEVILIEQFRIGALMAREGAWLLEIVGGIIEANETAEEVVKREGVEEAGCVMTELCLYVIIL